MSRGSQLVTPDTLAGPQPVGSYPYNGVQILATATDALQRGYRVELPRDCQAGSSESKAGRG